MCSTCNQVSSLEITARQSVSIRCGNPKCELSFTTNCKKVCGCLDGRVQSMWLCNVCMTNSSLCKISSTRLHNARFKDVIDYVDFMFKQQEDPLIYTDDYLTYNLPHVSIVKSQFNECLDLCLPNYDCSGDNDYASDNASGRYGQFVYEQTFSIECSQEYQPGPKCIDLNECFELDSAFVSTQKLPSHTIAFLNEAMDVCAVDAMIDSFLDL